jgi:hypothetical protein
MTLKSKKSVMKRILVAVLMFSGSLGIFAQAPDGFSYSAVVRNSSGDPLPDQAVSFLFTILKGSETGTALYSEKHNVTTDDFGFVSLVIGNGTDTIGSFASIPWGTDSYFLKTELDNTGGTSYTDMGTSQFFSVPYALYARTAGNGFSGNYNDLSNKPVTDGSETKITAGTDIKVTGNGTVVTPYKIEVESHTVGESFCGGIIFYVCENGQHGLIAAPRDQNDEISWNNGINRYTNTTGDGIRSGEMNTLLITALQTNDNPTGNFAAKVCADYSVTVNGVTFGDWYLPSKYELNLLFTKKSIVGGFSDNYYWSSTELSSISAWAQNFSTGIQYNLKKISPFSVRAIRAF